MTTSTRPVPAVVVAVMWLGTLGLMVGCTGPDLDDRQTRAEAAVTAAQLPQPTPTAIDERAESGGPGPVVGDVVAVARTPGPNYGRIVIISPDGSRRLLDRSCARVHIAAGIGVCSTPPDPEAERYETVVFDATDDRLAQIRRYISPYPSRVRVADDGSRFTTTGFVNGREYDEIGVTTTTETLALIDHPTGAEPMVGLNQFQVQGLDERQIDYRQFWGVSFAGDDGFWVTGYFDDAIGPEILTGDPATMTVDRTGRFGSCPSVSPDGTTVVFKRPRRQGGLDLVALDIESGAETVLGESRSVDDQVEWVDDDTIIYALHPADADESEEGSAQERYDLWTLDLTPGSEPVLFATGASSPAVIRSR